MKEDILTFSKQFKFNPQIEGELNVDGINNFVVVGMGGSHLAADLLKSLSLKINLLVHKNYGLPKNLSEEFLRNSLIILFSHSGNTEEVVDAFNTALKKNLKLAVVSTNGKLLELAKAKNVPYIKLSDIIIEPRIAMVLHMKALLTLIGEVDLLKEINVLSKKISISSLENFGRELADWFGKKIPVIYSSDKNKGLAMYWKINLNETSKIPAFYNVFPELNHNEMVGFRSDNELVKKFAVLLMEDNDDNDRIKRRMEVFKEMYSDLNLPIKSMEVKGESKLHKIFISIIMANWTSFYLAEKYKHNPKDSSVIEEFKQRIS